MVEKIKELKDDILVQLEQDVSEKGASRVDPKMVDMVKDLAEAEKSCWEAEYYRSVSEAMEDESMGYYDDGMGYARGGGGGGSQGGRGGRGGSSGGGSGYRREGGRGYRRGYRGQQRDSMGRYARRGYRRMEGGYGHDDMLMEVRQMMETADPQEREQLRMQLRQMTEQM